MSAVEIAATLAAVGLLALIWTMHHRLSRAVKLTPAPPELPSYPDLSVVRPIRGLDVGAKKNIEAALENGYPGNIETLFVFDDEDEPALPLVREAIATHEANERPGRAAVVICGAPSPGYTGKLNAMIAGLRESSGELIAFVDSDTRPDRRALAVIVQTLMQAEGAGSAFSPVVVSLPPITLGDAGYALLLNALYGAVAAAAAARTGGELPFIMGQFMVFRREAIDAIGGLETARGQLVDDMYLGARVKEEGYRNIVAPHHVPIIQQNLSLKEFAGVYRRWMIFSRSGLPGWSFKSTALVHGLSFWVGLLGCIGGLIAGLWIPALLGGLAAAAVGRSINRLHRALGGAPVRPRYLWAGFALLLVAPLIFATIYMKHEVRWRGRQYDLGADSRLSSSDDSKNDPDPAADDVTKDGAGTASRI